MLACTRLKEGPGIPLVFLHGFLGTSSDWEPLCAHLPSCTCLAIDLPGHGNSPFTDRFLDEMPSLEKCHLIGYSMGGRLAMRYAHAFPEKIATLTLISTHPGLATEDERAKRHEQDTAWAARIASGEDFWTDWYAQPIFDGFTPNLTKRRAQNREQLALALLCYSLALQPPTPLHKANIIVGERDAKYRALWSSTKPTPLVIPGAAHMVHLEQPELLAKELIWKK